MTTTENVASQDDASPASDGAVSWLARTIDAVVANGWAPLPIAPGTKKPGNPTWQSHRRPDGEGQVIDSGTALAWAQALANRQGDARNVAEWKGWGPDVGLGIRCDDVVGVDIDVTTRRGGGGRGADGRNPWADAATAGRTPEGRCCTTGRPNRCTRASREAAGRGWLHAGIPSPRARRCSPSRSIPTPSSPTAGARRRRATRASPTCRW